MPLQFADVMEKCYGYCAVQPVLLSFSDEFFVSLDGLNKAADKLYRTFGVESFANMRIAVSALFAALQGVVSFPPGKIADVDLAKIQEALIFKYRGKCDLYFVLAGEGGRSVRSIAEFVDFYSKKAAETTDNEKKVLYELRASQAAKLPAELAQLTGALNNARAFFAARGYYLTSDERVQANVELLKGGFQLYFDRTSKRPYGMTIGRYFSVTGMLQDHFVFAVDKSTGLIFVPGKVERRSFALFSMYEQLEQGAVTLDYAYAEQNPEKVQVVDYPPGYTVLPLKLFLGEERLSDSAREIINQTMNILFAPVLEQLQLAKKKRPISEKLSMELAELEEHYAKELR